MKNNAVHRTNTINTTKKLAMRLMWMVDPFSSFLANDDNEQNIPLWTALVLIVLAFALIALLAVVVSLWLFF